MRASGGWFVILAALLGSTSARAAGPGETVIDDPHVTHQLASTLEVLQAPAATWRIEDVASPDRTWGPAPKLARRGAPVYWVRLTIDSRLPGAQEYVVLPALFWQQVELHAHEASGWRVERSGADLALADRAVRSATSLFRVWIRPGREVFYLRFHSRMDDYLVPAEIALRLQPWSVFLEEDRRARGFQGIYAGLVLAMVLYNLFLFLAVRDRTYLLYVLYAATFGLIWTVRSGLVFEMLWPTLPRWDQLSSFCLIVAAVVFGNRFVASFLDTRRHAPWIHWALHALSLAAGLAAILGALGLWFVAEQILALASLLASLAYLAAGLFALRRGYRPARIYLLACGALIAGIVAYVLTFLGVLPRTFATLYGVQIGSAAEVLLLAFALGDRIRILRREKEEAQALYHRGLERAVRERTAELAEEKTRLEDARLEAEEANRRLQEANQRLEQISLLDDLTGIANRRHFEAVLDEEWRRCGRTGQPVSVILMDVDHFKSFNDHYGHPEGDHCLRRVASVLAEGCRRAGDLLARCGGEEFVVVLPGTGSSGAALKGELLRKAVESLAIPHSPLVLLPVVTISVGVGSAWPAEDGSTADLLAAADRALYAAKHQGRNQLVSAPEGQRSPTPSSS